MVAQKVDDGVDGKQLQTFVYRGPLICPQIASYCLKARARGLRLLKKISIFNRGFPVCRKIKDVRKSINGDRQTLLTGRRGYENIRKNMSWSDLGTFYG